MGKAAKALDDGKMLKSTAHRIRHLGVLRMALPRHRQRPMLMMEALAVHEGQAEEQPLRRRQLVIKATREAALGNVQSLGIGGKGARLAAKEVPRDLIEQQDERQGAPRRFLPVVQLPRCRPFMIGSKLPPDRVIERRIAAEPQRLAHGKGAFLTAAEPEPQDLIDARDVVFHQTLLCVGSRPHRIACCRNRMISWRLPSIKRVNRFKPS